MVFAMEGITYQATYKNDFQSAPLNNRLDHVKSMNANWITLGDEWRTSNKYSHDFHGSSQAVSKGDLEKAINAAHADGLKVVLKPMVRMDNWQPPHTPSNKDAWFNEYQKWIVEYAKVAQKTGVEMLSIGNEQSGTVIPANKGYWDKIINAVDAVYKGAITYSSQYLHVGDAEKTIWQNPKVDVIGVNAYHPVVAKNQNNATYAQMKDGWTSADHYNGSNPIWAMKDAYGNKSVIQYFADLADKLDKPVVHTEIGYASRNGTAWDPWVTNGGSVDNAEQADAFRAYFDAWKDYATPTDNPFQSVSKGSFFLGSQIWWTRAYGANNPTGHEYEGKAAQGVIKNAYASGPRAGADNNVPPPSGGNDNPPPSNGGGGTDTIVVTARGTQAFGQQAKMEVFLDNKKIGTVTVTAQLKNYTFKAGNLDNYSDLDIRFPNDARDSKGNDRNLFVQKVVADGEILKISDAIYDRDAHADLSGRSLLAQNGELSFDLDALLS